MARAGLLRPERGRLRVTAAGPMRRLLVLLVGLAGLTACSVGASPVDTCVEHSVEEGVDRTAARAACEDAVGESR